MATASISICSVINHVKSLNINSQHIFFDLKSAYDQTLYDVTEKIISHIFPIGNFAKTWSNISNRGRFKAVVGSFSSKVYEQKLGFSQGLPSSANKFDIYNHLFYACLKSVEMKQLTLNIKEMTLPPVFYADDGFSSLKLKNISDVIKVSNLLQKLKSTVNIEINFSKTKILTNGSYPENLHLLGTPCNYVKHLGLYISFDNDLAVELTYNDLFDKLKKRAQNCHFRFGENIFKRRNVCFAYMNSLAFHIFRIYAPNSKHNKKIWKFTANFLWSNGSSKRHRVAKKRIELGFEDGGLSMLLPEQQSFSIWLTSFFNTIKHANLYPESNLGQILAYKRVPVQTVLGNFGSKTLKKYMPKLKCLYPSQSRNMFSKAVCYLKKLEKNPSTFLHSTITTSTWANDISFNKVENRTLQQHGLYTIASILKSSEINKKYLYLPIIKDEVTEIFIDNPDLYSKLLAIVENVGKDFEFNTLECLTTKKNRLVLKPIMKISLDTPSIYSYYFKKMHKDKIRCPHPSIETRRRDLKYFPDPESFRNSFNLVLMLSIPLYYKSFLFEQFTRTLVSRTKLHEWNLIDNNICIKCNVKSDTEHAIFECFFPRYFANSLALFLDHTFNDGRPDFVFMKENFFLFNIYYEILTQNDYAQITLLCLVAKDRALKINKDTCLQRWNTDNCFSQMLLLTQFTSKLLNEIGISSSIIDKFIEFILQYKDNTHYFSN